MIDISVDRITLATRETQASGLGSKARKGERLRETLRLTKVSRPGIPLALLSGIPPWGVVEQGSGFLLLCRIKCYCYT